MALDNAMQVMTGDGSGVLARVAMRLQELPEPATYWALPDYAELFRLCAECSSFERVAKATVAIAAYSPQLAGKAIEAACRLIPLSIENPDRVSGEYVLGVALGIFDTGQWLDNTWRDIGAIRAFENSLPTAISQLVLPWPYATYVKLHHGWADIDDAYRGRLSKAIGAFIKDPNRQGSRRGAVSGTLKRVLEIVDSNDKFSELGRLIVDNICYAEFGRASALDRVKVMAALMDIRTPKATTTAK